MGAVAGAAVTRSVGGAVEGAVEGAEIADKLSLSDPPSPNGSRGSKEHQEKINQRIGELQDQGMRHVAGGSKPEETVRTPGGEKGSRRPDLTMEDPTDGSRYRENVGRAKQDGQPVARERRAQDDIQKATGQCGFSSYTPCKK